MLGKCHREVELLDLTERENKLQEEITEAQRSPKETKDVDKFGDEKESTGVIQSPW